MEIINATDGYKLGHHRMYPEGTEQVYSNWTPRSNKYFPEATEGSVVFGIQYLIKKYLIDEFNQNFFGFLGELKVLKERYPDSKFEIIVCHAVNIEGLVKLCNNFDHVIITNSYCDYGYKPSNNNLTMIDVCG